MPVIIPTDLPPDTTGDIRQVRQFRHPCANFHIRIRTFPVFDASQHIPHMVIKPFPLAFLKRNSLHPRLFARNHRNHFPSGTIQHQGPILAKECQPLFSIIQTMIDSARMIPYNIEILIRISSHQGIRRLHRIIRISKLAPASIDPQRQSGAHPLQGIIQQMHAPIGHQPAGIIPEETEIIMETIRIKRTLRSRSQPHVVIDTSRRVTIRLDRQGRLAILIGPHLHGTDTPDSSLLQIIGRLIPMRVTTLPLPHLDNPVILTGRLHHQVTLFNRIGKRLLHINIFSRLARPHSRQTMPMVRRTDDDYIHILIVDHPAPILI